MAFKAKYRRAQKPSNGILRLLILETWQAKFKVAKGFKPAFLKQGLLGIQRTGLTLMTICNELEMVSYKWKEIGIQLGIPLHVLEQFEKDSDPLSSVVNCWLKGNAESSVYIEWKSIVAALKDSTVGERGLAERIDKTYCRPQSKEQDLNLRTIYTALVGIKFKSFKIGLQLGISLQKLRQFQKEPDPLAAMIDYWLCGNVPDSDISWRTIIEVLKSDLVGERYLADKLTSMYSLEAFTEELLPGARTSEDDSEVEVLQGLTLKTVCCELHQVSYKWKDIGIQLGLPHFVLRMFETEDDPLASVVEYWLKGNVADVAISWKSIVTALRQPSVQENGLAEMLFEKYCKKNYQPQHAKEGLLSIGDVPESYQKNLPLETLQLDSSYPGVVFYDEPIVEKLTSLKEATIGNLEGIGVSLFIPQNSLKFKMESSEIIIRPCFTGPFELPDGYKPASPVYLIYQKENKFQKKVIVKMHHYASLQSDKDCDNLVFLFASCVPEYKNSGPRYVFKELATKGRFKQGSKVGEISSNHFSFETIARREGEGDNYSARLYWHDQQQSIIFCMCLDHPIYNKHCNNVMVRKNFIQEPLVKTAKILKEDVEVHSNDSTGLYVKFLVTPSHIQRREIDAPKKFLDLADYPKKLEDLLNRLKDLVDYPPKIRATINTTPGFAPQLHVDGLDKECCFNLKDILTSSQFESNQHIQEEAGLRRRIERMQLAKKSYPVPKSSLCLALAICISVLVSTAFMYRGPLYSQNIEDKFLEKRTCTERNAHISHSLDCHSIEDSKVLENYLKETTTKRDILCERLELRNCVELKLNDELEPFYLARSYIIHRPFACWEDIVSKLCEMDFLRLAKTVAIDQDIFYYYTHHCLSAKQ